MDMSQDRHSLCEPEQSKCTWACRRNIQRENLHAKCLRPNSRGRLWASLRTCIVMDKDMSQHTARSTPYTPHLTLEAPPFTLYTPHSALFTLHFTFFLHNLTLGTPHSTLSPLVTLDTPHYTLYTPSPTPYMLRITLFT